MFQTWDSVEPGRQNLTTLQERLIKEEMKLNVENVTNGAFYLEKKNRAKNKTDQTVKVTKYSGSRRETCCATNIIL